MVILPGADIAAERVRYARAQGITQMVLGHSDRSRWREIWRGSIVDKMTRALRRIDLRIVADNTPA